MASTMLSSYPPLFWLLFSSFRGKSSTATSPSPSRRCLTRTNPRAYDVGCSRPALFLLLFFFHIAPRGKEMPLLRHGPPSCGVHSGLILRRAYCLYAAAKGVKTNVFLYTPPPPPPPKKKAEVCSNESRTIGKRGVWGRASFRFPKHSLLWY